MKTLKYVKWLLISIGIGIVVLVGCGGSSGESSVIDNAATLEPSESSVIDNAVTLELGESSSEVTRLVGTSGLLIIVDIPGNPLDGFQLNIPSGSYNEEVNVTISYTPIISHSGNKYFNPSSPLISIENGGKYSNELMTVKIPLEMEDEYHYMAFYYDEITGELEGIPEIEHDDNSITIVTRHFSKIVVNKIQEIEALDIDSGFEVKEDGWPFENLRTWPSPGGICSGMSASTIYYYNERKQKLNEENLFTRYDNSTRNLTLDDEQSIKLASVIQERTDVSRYTSQWYTIQENTNDYFTYYMFLHSLALTNKPQYVGVHPDDGTVGHAMVVYKKSIAGLHVYDPNSPGDTDPKLEFIWDYGNESIALGEFKPFESKLNSSSGTDVGIGAGSRITGTLAVVATSMAVCAVGIGISNCTSKQSACPIRSTTF